MVIGGVDDRICDWIEWCLHEFLRDRICVNVCV